MRGLTVKNISDAIEADIFTVSGGVPSAGGCGLPGTEAAGVVIDSRICEKGYVFVATKGERADGADFIGGCFEKGALAVITEKTPAQGDPDGIWLVVHDSFAALKKLAAFYREQMSEVKIVGIVGSVGKTSTKELTAAALSEKYSVLATKGNLNNEVGVPLTLLSIRDCHEVAVVEMGISDFGEMSRLGAMVRPDIVLFTNIAPCHLEALGDLDGVLKAKTEVFDYIREGGAVVLNGADEKLRTVSDARGARIFFYGPGCVMSSENFRDEGINGSVFDAVYDDGRVSERFGVTLRLPGAHMTGNALGAALAARLLGVSGSLAARGIGKVLPSDTGRSVRETVGGVEYINDAYNASPLSVKGAIDILAGSEGRKVAMLGDMLELGKDAGELHAGIGRYAAEKGIDVLICAGELSANTAEAFERAGGGKTLWFRDTDELLGAQLPVEKGDTVLIKASHGMHFEKILKRIKESEI